MCHGISISKRTGVVKLNGRPIAFLRGKVLDVRRASNGFIHAGRCVAISEELLNRLSESTIVQITNVDSGEVFSSTVGDFKKLSVPFQFSGYENQRAIELSRMHFQEGERGDDD